MAARVHAVVRILLWLEMPWILLLALPLTFPGRLLPIAATPTLIFLLVLGWPLHLWTAWRAGRRRPDLTLVLLSAMLVALTIGLGVASDLRQAWLMAAHLAIGIALAIALPRWPLSRRWPRVAYALPIVLAASLSLLGPPLLTSPLSNPRAVAFYAPLVALTAGWGETLNANILAGGLLPAIPLTAAWGLLPWGRGRRGGSLGLMRSVLLLGLTAWLLQVLALTESRGALVAAVASLGLVGVLRWRRLTLPAGLLTLAGGVWLLLHDPWAQLQAVMATGLARDYNMRVEIWVRSGQVLCEHLATGIGLGAFVPTVMEQTLPVRVALPAPVTHAHNLWLQVGLDLGVLGLAAYVGWTALGVVQAGSVWRSTQGVRRSLAAGILAALLAINVHGVVDAPLWNSKLAFLPWLLFGLAQLLATMPPPSSPTHAPPSPASSPP